MDPENVCSQPQSKVSNFSVGETTLVRRRSWFAGADAHADFLASWLATSPDLGLGYFDTASEALSTIVIFHRWGILMNADLENGCGIVEIFCLDQKKPDHPEYISPKISSPTLLNTKIKVQTTSSSPHHSVQARQNGINQPPKPQQTLHPSPTRHHVPLPPHHHVPSHPNPLSRRDSLSSRCGVLCSARNSWRTNY